MKPLNTPKKLNMEEIIKLISILKLYPAFNIYMLINVLIPFALFFMLLSLKYDISICITKKEKENKTNIHSINSLENTNVRSIGSDSKLSNFYIEQEKEQEKVDESKKNPADEYKTIWEQYSNKKNN